MARSPSARFSAAWASRASSTRARAASIFARRPSSSPSLLARTLAASALPARASQAMVRIFATPAAAAALAAAASASARARSAAQSSPQKPAGSSAPSQQSQTPSLTRLAGRNAADPAPPPAHAKDGRAASAADAQADVCGSSPPSTGQSQ